MQRDLQDLDQEANSCVQTPSITFPNTRAPVAEWWSV
jgi:hypothetical protein